jgi:hypothetical protein
MDIFGEWATENILKFGTILGFLTAILGELFHLGEDQLLQKSVNSLVL